MIICESCGRSGGAGPRERRERDQARDALADILLALDDPGPHRAVLNYTPALVAAIQQARTVLRGEGLQDGNP